MKDKRWFITDLASKNISVASILESRNFTQEEINKFLNVKLTDFSDCNLLADFQKTVERIKLAINRKDKIVIYGDYDVDGITSTSIMFLFLQEYHADVTYYIPSRFEEGYGLNCDALRKFAAEGVDLVITVDCGITSFDEADLAKELGLELIITDHHNLDEKLPNAYALINPKRKDQDYPYTMLVGAGIAFMIASAFIEKESDLYKDLICLAMIGTIADIAPLSKENRIIVSFGLRYLKETKIIGLKSLLKLAGLSPEYKASQIAFQLAPRLNAAGRLATAGIAVELLITQDQIYADQIAQKLDELNKERRQTEQEILNKAEIQIQQNSLCLASGFVIVWGEEWHEGVVGIVASRLKENYYLPTVVCSQHGNKLKASARSINGFSIYDALYQHKHLLEKFGGHSQAAGLSMEFNQLTAFIDAIKTYNQQHLTPEILTPKLHAEKLISSAEINFEFIESLKKMEPFGVGNPKPNFILANARVEAVKLLGAEQNHAKFSISKNAKLFEAICFNFGHRVLPKASSRLDLACQLDINEFRGTKTIQLMIKDMRSYDPYQNKLAKKWYIYYVNMLLRSAFTLDFLKPTKTMIREDGMGYRVLGQEQLIVSSFESLLELYFVSYDLGMDLDSLLKDGKIKLFYGDDVGVYYDLPFFSKRDKFSAYLRVNDHDQLIKDMANSRVDRRRFAALYRKLVKVGEINLFQLMYASDNVLMDSFAILFFEEAGFAFLEGTQLVLNKTQHQKTEFNYSQTNKLYQALTKRLYNMAMYIDRQKL